MSDTDMLKRKRGHAKAALTRIERSTSIVNDNTAVEELYVHLELLEKAYIEFKDYDEQIVAIDDTLSDIDAFEQRYTKAKAVLRKQIHGRSPMVTAVQEQLNNTMRAFTTHQKEMREQSFSAIPKDEIKLPRIQIPFFTGKYNEFPSFKDLFGSSVHSNSTLTDVHKFQYLKSFLRDDAANLLRHIPVTGANYSEAWDKLCARYDNKGLVITSLIRQFVAQPTITKECATSLRKLCDTSDEVMRGLKALGPDAERRDPWLIYFILQKLDEETRKQWPLKSIDTECPSFISFISFIEKRCSALETCEPIQHKRTPAKSATMTYHTEVTDATESTANALLRCIKCNEPHRLHDCSQYTELEIEQRREFVAQARVCFNCLFKGHTSNTCPSKRRCFICQRKHHTSLHSSQTPNVNTLSKEEDSSEKSSLHQPPALPTNTAVMTRYSLLPTALVKVRDLLGKNHYCRVLLDSGSEASLITEACVNKLQLTRNNCRIPISGVASSATTKGRTTLTITSRVDAKFATDVNVFILDRLTSRLPKLNAAVIDTWHELKSLHIADPLEHQCHDVDILLGASHFFKLLRQGQITGPNGVIAQNTAFGWIISGGDSKFDPHILQMEFNIDETLRKFWELEELPSQEVLTPEQNYCEELFVSTHTRDTHGRFVVRLPFAKDTKQLGTSIQQATSRFKAIESKLQRQDDLRGAYKSFMNEYQQLGHMAEIQQEQLDFLAEHCYLPHHPIVKPNNASTKVRVVFNGSAVTSSSISLNSKLLVGPIVQLHLISILMRFRAHPVAFTADIERMYRQIKVDARDCDYQRIIWRDNPADQLKHFRLLTVTYGTSAAPFLATRTLAQVGLESKSDFPQASNSILNDFYVDDLLSGSSDTTSAIALAHNITKILIAAGFPLHKFASNSPELLSSLANVYRDRTVVNLDGQSDHKILGLHWDTQKDTSKFHVSELPEPSAYTKRSLLSEASRLYDPLGWLAPAIIPIKALFQQLWLLHLDWDESLPHATMDAWVTIRSNLKQLEKINIPRLINITPSTSELHGFADASSTAYAAVLYCRTVDEFSNIQVRLIAAKTRVAPINTISVPRLELCGALLLATLIKSVVECMKVPSIPVYCWTDSEIVLHWLSHHPSKWKVFISNRTTQIMDMLPTTKWNHVSSSDNPADCASRGCSPSDLLAHPLWWKGPPWLNQQKHTWPQGRWPNAKHLSSDMVEERAASVHKVTMDQDLVSIIAERTSSFTKMKRILIYVKRFGAICKSKDAKALDDGVLPHSGQITPDEYKWAEYQLCKLVQQVHFAEELRLLNLGRPILKGKLTSLSPYIDDNGVLRVGGRLKHAECSYEQKHPIILPNTHVISRIILSYLHLTYLHPGPTLLSHLSRQSFWIITVRKLARQVTNDCLICRRLNSHPSNQLMGNLPAERVTPTRPFTHTGLDMAGPIEIATKSGRGARIVKAYIVLFICMSVKAIHLELAGNLTTDAFLAALKRFVSRRGLPSTISCDNGTNFIGAKRKLNETQQQLHKSTTDKDVLKFTTERGITWKLNPPASPHFGGLWEAAVRSVKHHLTRVTRRSRLTFEEVTTLLCQIEAILNSRPLTPVTEHIGNIMALTPAHFLTTAPLLSVPEIDNSETPDNRLTRWEELQKRVLLFWKRYMVEYINNLQQRTKWRTQHDNLNVGDVVLVKDINLPALSWLLARILKVHPGDDNIVRVVTLKTANSTLDRPVAKLIKLVEVKETNP